jgi:hypothetical protein
VSGASSLVTVRQAPELTLNRGLWSGKTVAAQAAANEPIIQAQTQSKQVAEMILEVFPDTVASTYSDGLAVPLSGAIFSVDIYWTLQDGSQIKENVVCGWGGITRRRRAAAVEVRLHDASVSWVGLSVHAVVVGGLTAPELPAPTTVWVSGSAVVAVPSLVRYVSAPGYVGLGSLANQATKSLADQVGFLSKDVSTLVQLVTMGDLLNPVLLHPDACWIFPGIPAQINNAMFLFEGS